MTESARIPEDVLERQTSLDITRSFLVQAPAGSGKTELLIQRYLMLLAVVDAPEEILAMTFTRKAAAEMRTRVLLALQRATNESPPVSNHERHTWKLARAALAQNELRGWELLHNPSRMRMQTIDSFNMALTRLSPWMSQLGVQPDIVEHASELYCQAVQQTLDKLENPGQLSDSISTLLLHFDNDHRSITDMLTTMLETRDQWIRYLNDFELNPESVRSAMQLSFRKLIETALQRVNSLTPECVIEELPRLAAFAAETLLQDGKDSSITQCRGVCEWPDPTWDRLLQWNGLRELLLTKDGDIRKTVTVAHGFPSKTPQKDRMTALLRELADDPKHQHFLAELRNIPSLPSHSIPNEQWTILKAIIDVLRHCVCTLHDVFLRSGKVDYTEIAFAARRALGQEIDPTDLAMMLEYKLSHILVDEFQDTSLGQYRLLELITAGWTEGDGHTLFLVGDPMQSIYRFREAEVGLYLRTWEQQRLNNVRLHPMRLSVNFRSQSGIVNWVNDTFSEILDSGNDVTRSAVGFAPSSPFALPNEERAVVFNTYFADDGVEEANYVVNTIRKEREGRTESGKPPSIAVLVRSRKHLFHIIEALHSTRTPFQAVDISSLHSSQTVQDLLALTKAMLHPADRLSWLAILRAPWCGLELSDLHALAAAEKHRTIMELLDDEAILQRLSDNGHERVLRMRQLVTTWQNMRQRNTLRRWIEGLWVSLGGPACIDAQGLADADVYFDMIDEMEVGGDMRNFQLLHDGITKLKAPSDPASDGSVQIMTIHKAKGLEFDVVILPSLGKKAVRDTGRIIEWESFPGENSETEVLIAPRQEAGSGPDETYNYLYRLHQDKAGNETKRLLYVACTRARKRLYLSSTIPVKVDRNSDAVSMKSIHKNSFLALVNNSFTDRIERAFLEWQQSSKNLQADLSQEGQQWPRRLLHRLPADWSLPPLPTRLHSPGMDESVEDTEEHDLLSLDFQASEMTRVVGVIVHRHFEMIAERGLEAWENMNKETKQHIMFTALHLEGLTGKQVPEAADRVQSALRMALDDERGRWILARHDEQHTEFDLTGVDNQTVRRIKIDRTFVENGIRWIIDYKTGEHGGIDVETFLMRKVEEYRPQLQRYVRMLSRLERRPIRAALYFPLLQSWREVAIQ